MVERDPSNAIIVSASAHESGDPYDLVYSNIEVVNWCLDRHFVSGEIPADALRSYFVDYFLGEIHNGGFSQFVYNSQWGECVDYITTGFEVINAKRHLELFERAASKMHDRLGVDGLKTFFASDYFGDNAERDLLEEFTDGFHEVADAEDLVELNSIWLRSHRDLLVLTDSEIERQLARRYENIPDMDERISESLASEPR